MTDLELIRNSGLFDGLDDVELGKIAEGCLEREYSMGTAIIEENEPPKELLFFIKDGEIMVSTAPMDGCGESEECPTLLSTFGPGEAFGEVSIVDNHPHSATVRALSDVKVLELPARHFHELAEKNHKIGYVVMKNIAALICQRLRSSNFAVKHFGLWGKIDEPK
ncbi:MAG: cyclic nucleotide-binding domain-containing protein [bacterium]